MEIMSMMIDDTYLYALGGLVLLLVVFGYFYYSRMSKSSDDETSQIHELPNQECDGDKCFIRQEQPKYDKCDDE